MGGSSPVQGVWFPQWAEVLARVRLKDLEQRAYRSAIMDYLGFCKRSRQRATVESARKFMEEVESRHRLGVSQLATWKAALNWFFRTAKREPSPDHLTSPRPSPLLSGVERESILNSQRGRACVRGKEPPLAATDLGGPEWEKKLIRELRSRHYEWRTEQAYRMVEGVDGREGSCPGY